MVRGKTHVKARTVLFIDDETPWLDMIKMVTKGESKFKVITASSGEDALRQLKRKKPDLILSDVRMPVMNGFDLYEKVRSNPEWKHVPYVFMSSIDDLDAKRIAKELGADDYVEKPFDTQKIKDIVLTLLFRFK
ncbi:MAG: response regulator [Ignavibacteriae bacterium]|nr:response regulator [Ignavibacteriota bacterium]